MEHDTAKFWGAFEDIKDPLELTPMLKTSIRERHEKTKAISIRLYPSQLRMAKAVADRTHVPYQVLLRNIIENGLSHLRHTRAGG